MRKQSSVPNSPFGRLTRLGRLAGGIATGMVSEGVRQLASGRIPDRRQLLLTPANATRLTERLAELRGAAMKIGQLLSMEAGEFLPPELTQILGALREEAHIMPLGEVAAVLETAWGKRWERRFRRFEFRPIAAASIGQVHRAETRNGHQLAIKVQYPGVRESIDSDVKNVATLLNTFRLLPTEIDLSVLLDEARRQLHQEADYLREAGYLREFAALVEQEPGFEVPETVAEWTTAQVLPMDYLPGVPIDQCTGADRALRDGLAERLIRLTLREVLDWGLVQTDPNFANFRYDANRDRIGLLDFGATRRYSRNELENLRRILQAAVSAEEAELEAAAQAVGYLGENDSRSYRDTILALLRLAAEPIRQGGVFDFGRSDLSQRMAERVIELRVQQRSGRLPPPAILFLHRKVGGIYLLCARLRARVEVESLFAALPIEDLNVGGLASSVAPVEATVAGLRG